VSASHLQREILEQPDVLRRLLEAELDHVSSLAGLIRQAEPRSIVIAARGSSDNVARYGQYLFGCLTGLPVALATPSLVTIYQRQLRLEQALVIGISQSGQSPDIAAVVAEGTRSGALTIAVTNDPQSPLASSASHCIDLHVEAERSVGATKTYTASLLALAMLGAALQPDPDSPGHLEKLPGLISGVVSSAQEIIGSAEQYAATDACVVISRGYNYATAFEIALKLKELAYVLAEPYSSADFQHGPVALIEQGFPVIVVVAEGPMAPELVRMLSDLRSRGARLIVISALAQALALARTPLAIPAGVPEWLSPLVCVVPGQLFALGLTLAKGLDPDHPRGLRKVTRTT
jgi:glucosamine--fructose-6-phosphate aminotransferase (isomerizing)